jgi:glycerophosphoryl diester phosphodiesterase
MRVRFICLILSAICCSITNSFAQQDMFQHYQLPSLYNDDGDGFIIIAHRGASAYYPENTMAAFEGAVEMEAEMIEVDVLLSKDGVPVVYHDSKLNDHTNGDGLVSNHTIEELKELDAGSWFDNSFTDQRIPTLEEVLAFASGNIALNIEIKAEAVSDQIKDGVVEKSLNLVREYGMEEYVLFSSFDYRAIKHLKELEPELSVALLYNRSRSGRKLPHELIHEYKADAFNCSYRQFNKKRIASLREYKIPSFIYTVDLEARMQRLIAAGVNGIFTNKPDVLRRVVEKYHH